MIEAKTSPLILRARCFPMVMVEACPSFSQSATDVDYKRTEIEIQQMSVWNAEQNAWGGSVSVECWPAEPDGIPYRFKIQAFGLFEIREGTIPKEEEEKFVGINGSSVLYSMIRDMLRTITMAGPYAMVELPLAYFAFQAEEEQKP